MSQELRKRSSRASSVAVSTFIDSGFGDQLSMTSSAHSVQPKDKRGQGQVGVPRIAATTVATLGAPKASRPRLTTLECCRQVTLVTWYLLGTAVCLAIAVANSWLHQQLHENELWFTNIQEVEREISLRTETGLYYSYYKQLVQAPSLSVGLRDLTVDNRTEHPDTINILERFNVYQEVALAAVWRHLPVSARSLFGGGGAGRAILFYLYAVFGLQTLLLLSVASVGCALACGSWPAGAIAALLCIIHRLDTTRVTHTAPLRENFALPFLWAQIACITYFFKANTTRRVEVVCKLGVFLFTFLFSICWQFNQFILLLQAVSVFVLWSLGLIPPRKVVPVLVFHAMSLSLVSMLQFGNKMLLTSLAMNFIPAALLVIFIWRGNIGGSCCIRFSRLCLTFFTVIILTGLVRFAMKTFFLQKADEHIFKFLLAKFNISNSTDFDAQLYLCNGAFSFLPSDFYVRMTSNWTLPLYAAFHSVGVLLLLHAAVVKGAKEGKGNSVRTAKVSPGLSIGEQYPEVMFHIVQSVPFACMAATVMRMKYLWSVYMCLFAPACVCSSLSWRPVAALLQTSVRVPAWIVSALRLAVAIGYAMALLHLHLPGLQSELQEEREFWDPDTVELMQWIRNSTSKRAAFSGSMQLLAGVKLCTGHPITNHPHYEDEGLRARTWELYQMYGRKPAHEVHATLRKYGASYVILEDSICLVPPDGCRTPDIVDIAGGVIPRGNVRADIQGLRSCTIPRFCDEVRHGRGNYSRLFKLSMANKTFRVYRVM